MKYNLYQRTFAIRKIMLMKNPVIIFGVGGIAKAALEILNSNKMVVYGFLEDDKTMHNKEIQGVPILGRMDDDGFLKLIGKKAEAFVAVDENALRKGIVKMVNEKRKKMPINAIHNFVSIPESAFIGHGNFINAGVTIGANAKISNHCILNSNATIEYEATLGDFVQIGAGSILNPGVSIEDEVFIGAGVTIVGGVKIGKGARIGAGSIVVGDVKKGETVFGNPAMVVKH